MDRLSLFDFDGTLTHSDSLLAIIRHAIGPWRMAWLFLVHLSLLIKMKLRLADNGKVKEHIFGHVFAGMSLEEFDKLCQTFATSHQRLLRRGAKEKLQQLINEGQRVMVVSASVDNWVRPFIPNGVEVVGTLVETENGVLTGRFLTPNCYGPEKVRRIEEQLANPRVHYYISAYGDSRGDREMLAMANEAHMKKHSCLMGLRKEERLPMLLLLLAFLALNALTIACYYEQFTPFKRYYWPLFIRNFHLSGFDPITYSVVSDWSCGYNVYRHPLLAFFMYPACLLNQCLMHVTGINCAIFIVGAIETVAAFYAALFFRRILHELAGLRPFDATLLTWMLFGFSHVMLAAMVPDHFMLSMALLLGTLYIAGCQIQRHRPMTTLQTLTCFFLTAGVSLNNGLKVFIASLFSAKCRVQSVKLGLTPSSSSAPTNSALCTLHFALLFTLPSLLIWSFARWEYGKFVWPVEQKQHAAKAKKAKEERTKLLAAEQWRKDSLAGKASPEPVAPKKPKRIKQGKPISNGEFLRWTDITTARWTSIVENLFGESIQLHRDHLLEDEMRHRPMFVSYRTWWSYAIEAVLVLLFLVGIWYGRHNRLLWLALSWAGMDMLLHVGLGFALNEVYIMAAHWIYVMPLAMAFILKTSGRTRLHTCHSTLFTALTLWLWGWNLALIVQYMFLT